MGALVESPMLRGGALALPDSPQDAPEVGSPRRHGTAAAAAPCTPPQSPDRSELELTPGPSVPDEDNADHPCSKQADVACNDPVLSCGLRKDNERISSEGSRAKERRKTDAEVLFIDIIAHCISTYTRRSWAPVCSSAARAVRGVLDIERKVWHAAILHLTSFCQPFFQLALDPEGHLLYARQELVDLKQQATQAPQPSDFDAVGWRNRWYCGIDVLASIYEHVWLQHHQLYLQVSGTVARNMDINSTLRHVLHQRDVRLGLAEPESQSHADW
eukprot:TRINITY_DN4454_c0_g2_i7.p1 TRINITY_DN4454_c0_g2~~TRINITY_DN4454_c0_g2_i7.p1  ORF type:complete len:311 (+),score=30.74 TRINITY_DN4454_c0_g2_i7:117-935(+)